MDCFTIFRLLSEQYSGRLVAFLLVCASFFKTVAFSRDLRLFFFLPDEKETVKTSPEKILNQLRSN